MGNSFLNILYTWIALIGLKLAKIVPGPFLVDSRFFSQNTQFSLILLSERAKTDIYCRPKIGFEKIEFSSHEGHENIRLGAREVFDHFLEVTGATWAPVGAAVAKSEPYRQILIFENLTKYCLWKLNQILVLKMALSSSCRQICLQKLVGKFAEN